ncbi:MAG: glycosyltransferase [Burkholderiaceae bacterium]|nr:glycosyltransferase [Burkholderiaceae bacterium]
MRLLNAIRSVDPVHGGPAEGLRQSIAATRAMGHTEEVLTLDAPGDACVASYPTTVHALGPAHSNYGRAERLLPWLREHAGDYDAVVVHGLWQHHGLSVWRALRGGPVPYFVYPHGMLDPWFRQSYPLKHAKKLLYWWAAEFRVLRDASAVLFTAEEEQRLAAQTFWPYRVKPAVVGYGVAVADVMARVDAEVFCQQWPATRGKRIVLFLGRLHPKKGGDLLIEAFARVAARDPSLHLVMAGPDDRSGVRAGWENLALRSGVSDRVTFTGMLTGDVKWAALRAAEVFALPSHQENFGIAVVEALAMGVPVLISNKVNIWREIVADDAGFASSDTLAGTVDTLDAWLSLELPRRAAMRQHAVDCYQRHFHMTAAAQRLIDTITPHIRHAIDTKQPR